MADNNCNSGVNQNFELVAPVKILVKPGFCGIEDTPSLRRRSITSIPLNEALSGSNPTASRGENENIFLVSDPVYIPRHGDGRSEITIQIENSTTCDGKNVAYYLRHCFRLMYLSGMSTYDPKNIETGEEKTWMDGILRGLQKVFLTKYINTEFF